MAVCALGGDAVRFRQMKCALECLARQSVSANEIIGGKVTAATGAKAQPGASGMFPAAYCERM